MKSKKPRKRGAARMQELGKKPVQIWLSAKQREYVEKAISGRSTTLAGFVLYATIEEARRVTIERSRHDSM